MDDIITEIHRDGFIGGDMITGITWTENMCSIHTEAIRNTGIGTGIMEEGDKVESKNSKVKNSPAYQMKNHSIESGVTFELLLFTYFT